TLWNSSSICRISNFERPPNRRSQKSSFPAPPEAGTQQSDEPLMICSRENEQTGSQKSPSTEQRLATYPLPPSPSFGKRQETPGRVRDAAVRQPRERAGGAQGSHPGVGGSLSSRVQQPASPGLVPLTSAKNRLRTAHRATELRPRPR
ncbi:unnamed protein product, partial [Rangifer tarandus platyrhynchus]